jgi:DNA-directed RNA polymerase specialized sigma24 family protein
LAAVAKKRFMALGAQCRAEDAADAVQEAFTAFFRRVQQGACPDCRDRNDLWCLLVKIANNKARQLARGEEKAKTQWWQGAARVRDSMRQDGRAQLHRKLRETKLVE